MAITTFDFFKNIHDRIVNEYIKVGVAKEKSNAKVLETFLSQIKQELQDTSFNTSEGIGKFISHKALKDSLSAMGGSLGRHLLSEKGGLIGEQDIAIILDSFMKTVLEKSKVEYKSPGNIKETIITGTSRAKVDIDQKMEKNVLSHIDGLYKLMRSELNANIKKNTKRPIKADINMTKGEYPELSTNIQVDISDVKRIYNILRTATFSIKNYSVRQDEDKFKHLGIGDTNFDKVFMALEKFFPGLFNGVNDIDDSNPDSTEIQNVINSHLIHMRFLYELSGIGLEPKPVDYFIYNAYNSPFIFVRSVRDLVKRGFSAGNHRLIDTQKGTARGTTKRNGKIIRRDQRISNNIFLNYSINISKSYFLRY